MSDQALSPAHVERLLLLARHAGSLVFWATKTATEGYDFVNEDDRGDTTNAEELASAVADVQVVVTLMAGCKDLDPDDVSKRLVDAASLMLMSVQESFNGAPRHQDVFMLAANLVGVTYNHEHLRHNRLNPPGDLP